MGAVNAPRTAPEDHDLDWLPAATMQHLSRSPGIASNKEELATNPGGVMEEYFRFLRMAIDVLDNSKDHRATPSKTVDEMWHTHMLHTEDYWVFSASIANRYIPHEPCYEAPRTIHEPNWVATQAQYRKMFGQAPSPAIWQRMGESGCCSPPEPTIRTDKEYLTRAPRQWRQSFKLFARTDDPTTFQNPGMISWLVLGVTVGLAGSWTLSDSDYLTNLRAKPTLSGTGSL